MSTIGPKGPPTDAHKAQVLQFRRPEKTLAPEATGVTETAPTEQTSTQTSTTPTTSEPGAVFDGTGNITPLVQARVEGAALSQLVARLKARGEFTATRVARGDELSTRSSAGADESQPVQQVAGPVVVTTDEGKVLSGSVEFEGKAGLDKMEGVVRAGGSVTLAEGIVKNADLLSLRDLKSVEGRFTFEGLRSRPVSNDG